jgi:hypothetical protein
MSSELNSVQEAIRNIHRGDQTGRRLVFDTQKKTLRAVDAASLDPDKDLELTQLDMGHAVRNDRSSR